MSDTMKVLTGIGVGLAVANVITDGDLRDSLYERPKYFELILVGASIMVLGDAISKS